MRNILLSLILLIPFASAQGDLKSSLGSGSFEPNYISAFFGLVVVICLIYITGIVYKKLTKIKFEKKADEKYGIEIMSCTSLGQNKNLYVVKINSSVSLIGATNNNISYLKDLGDDYA